MVSVAITGASGTVGQVLRAHFARADDVALRLVDRDARGDPAVEIFDLTADLVEWTGFLGGVDVVIHLAANSSPQAQWADLRGPNLDAALNLYRAAAEQGVRHVVLASSIWAAAARQLDSWPIGAAEMDSGTNPYGASKLFAERVAHAYWRSDRVATTILRIGALSLAGSTGGLRRGWDMEARLSPRDLCAAVDRAVRAPANGVRTLNLISRNEGARFTLHEAEAEIGYVPQDHFAAVPAVSRLRALIGRIVR